MQESAPDVWATFWPDLVVGATTGLFVGLVLLIAQWLSDSRQKRLAARREWAALREQLEHAAFLTWHEDLDADQRLPDAAIEMARLTDGAPLAYWRDNLRSQDPLLEVVISITRFAPSYLNQAKLYEQAFWFAGIPIPAELERPAQRLYWARFYGETDEEAFKAVTFRSSDEQNQIVAFVETILTTPRATDALQHFQEARDAYLRLLLLAREIVQREWDS